MSAPRADILARLVARQPVTMAERFSLLDTVTDVDLICDALRDAGQLTAAVQVDAAVRRAEIQQADARRRG